MPMSKNNEFNNFLSRLEKLSDEHRKEATSKRHQSGNRTARENLHHLILKFLSLDDFFGKCLY